MDDRNLAVLRNTINAAVITETGFMSNSNDLMHLATDGYSQTDIGEAIGYAIWYWLIV